MTWSNVIIQAMEQIQAKLTTGRFLVRTNPMVKRAHEEQRIGTYPIHCVVWCGVVWCGVVWYDVVLYGMMACGVV